MRYGQIATAIKDCLDDNGTLSIRQSDISDPQMDAVVVENWDALCVGFQAQIATYDAMPGFYQGLSPDYVDRLRNVLTRQSQGTGSQQWLATLTQAASEVDRHIPMKVLASTFATSKSEDSHTLFITLPIALRGNAVDELDGFTRKLYRQVHLINSAYGEPVATFGGFYQGSDVIALLFSGLDHLSLIYEVFRIAHNAVVEMRSVHGDYIRRVLRFHDQIRGVDVPKDGEDDNATQAMRDAALDMAQKELSQLLEDKGEVAGGEKTNALSQSLTAAVDLLAAGAEVGIDDKSRVTIETKVDIGIKIEINGNNNYTILCPGALEGFALPAPPDTESPETSDDTDDTEE